MRDCQASKPAEPKPRQSELQRVTAESRNLFEKQVEEEAAAVAAQIVTTPIEKIQSTVKMRDAFIKKYEKDVSARKLNDILDRKIREAKERQKKQEIQERAERSIQEALAASREAIKSQMQQAAQEAAAKIVSTPEQEIEKTIQIRSKFISDYGKEFVPKLLDKILDEKIAAFKEIERKKEKPVAPKAPSVSKAQIQPERKKEVEPARRREAKIEEEIEEIPQPFATNVLLIFLDDTEHSSTHFWGAITNTLITALRQKPCPILVSRSLLNNLFSGQHFANFRSLIKQNPDYGILKNYLGSLLKKINQHVPGVELSKKEKEEILNKIGRELGPEMIACQMYTHPPIGFSADKITQAVVVELLAFKREEWIIKYVGSDNALILLIPRSWKNMATYKEMPEKRRDILTPTELEFGMKIDHMPPVESFEMMVENFYPRSPIANNFMNALWDLKKEHAHQADVSDIFVTKLEYRNNKIPFNRQPRWVFYLTGHGGINQSIAGLPIDSFKLLLDFLERKIKTVLFVYSTCNAAGTNEDLIYKDAKSKLLKPHSYAIAFEGVTESAVNVARSTVNLCNLKIADINWFDSTLEVGETFYNFRHFARYVTQENTIDYYHALFFVMFGLHFSDLPQLKLPGEQWFKIVDMQNIAVSIGSILSQTRETIDVGTFFKRKKGQPEPRFVLLETTFIPHLIVNTDKIPKFISIMPGDSIHVIKKISSRKFSVDQLINAFVPDGKVGANKKFMIQEIEGAAPKAGRLPGNTQKVVEALIELSYNAETNKMQVKKYFIVFEGGIHYLYDFSTNVAKLANYGPWKDFKEALAKLQSEELGIEQIKRVVAKRPAAIHRISRERVAKERKAKEEIKETKDEIQHEIWTLNRILKDVEEARGGLIKKYQGILNQLMLKSYLKEVAAPQKNLVKDLESLMKKYDRAIETEKEKIKDTQAELRHFIYRVLHALEIKKETIGKEKK
jgi:hypothetical protein